MISSLTIALLCLLATTALATECDSLKACYLRDVQTGKELTLTGSDSYKIKNGLRYSVRCAVNGKDESDFIKFFYDGKVHDEFAEPRWLDGDSNEGAYVVAVPYLATCGIKTIKIQGHVWSHLCFEKDFTLVAECDGDGPASPVSSPSSKTALAPATVTVNAPRSSVVASPTLAPYNLPVALHQEPPQSKASPTQTLAPVEVTVVQPTSAPFAVAENPAVVGPSKMPVALTVPTSTPVARTMAPGAALAGQPTSEVFASPASSATSAPMATVAAPTAEASTPVQSTTLSPTDTPVTVASPPATSTSVQPMTLSPMAAPVMATTAAPALSVTVTASLPTASPQVPNVPAEPTESNEGTKNTLPTKPLNPATPRRECRRGFKMVSGFCVRKWCRSNYKCPAGMERVPGRHCYRSMYDCKCRQGYAKRLGGQCILKLACKLERSWYGWFKKCPTTNGIQTKPATKSSFS
jgi:hypothetical protein